MTLLVGRIPYLELSHGHKMYYETHGTPTKTPVVILHGGPGGGINKKHLTYFNRREWYVILFDQRGCGRSTPFGLESLSHNTTQLLVEDIERLRTHLTLDAWFVYGASWGTTLGIVYAETHPTRVRGLYLRSICMITSHELEWLYGGLAGQVYPEEWQKFIAGLDPPYTYKNIINQYRTLLTNPDRTIRQDAAKQWTRWEDDVSFLIPRVIKESIHKIESIAILKNHYFYHNAWLKPNQLVKNAYKLKDIPVTLLHCRYDMVCPVDATFQLSKVIPHATVTIVPDAGHGNIKQRYTRRKKAA